MSTLVQETDERGAGDSEQLQEESVFNPGGTRERERERESERERERKREPKVTHGI